jgi:iron complex transport system permease protein
VTGAGRLVLLLALLAVAVLTGIRVGAVGLTVADILGAFTGTADRATQSIVLGLRTPRVVLAALCGAALALSGGTCQALLRNPLADPYILGISSGAAVGAVGAVMLGVDDGPTWLLPAAAFAGSLLALMLVLRIATITGEALDSRILILAGVVVAAFGNAIVLLFLTFADVESFRTAMFWMMGSLSGATWTRTATLGVPLAIAGVLLFGYARSLDALAIGDTTAAALGVSVENTKRACFVLASLLAAVSVSVSGVVGFVGLITPHAIRLVWGSDHRFLLPASALLGASFLVFADLGARSIVPSTELPLGVVTALVGVPFFVLLLRRRDG